MGEYFLREQDVLDHKRPENDQNSNFDGVKMTDWQPDLRWLRMKKKLHNVYN